MIEKFEDRIRRYPGQAVHDATGLGDVVEGYIHGEAKPFLMVGRDRSALLIRVHQRSREERDRCAEMIPNRCTQNTFTAERGLMSFGAGHLPDTMSAAALAWFRSVKMLGPMKATGKSKRSGENEPEGDYSPSFLEHLRRKRGVDCSGRRKISNREG